jgi:hypothetical protein
MCGRSSCLHSHQTPIYIHVAVRQPYFSHRQHCHSCFVSTQCFWENWYDGWFTQSREMNKKELSWTPFRRQCLHHRSFPQTELWHCMLWAMCNIRAATFLPVPLGNSRRLPCDVCNVMIVRARWRIFEFYMKIF